ncbi:hypothetical protein RDI58_022218 [Solanum bulbocastanum]|uniref:Uncharacterized protein n=1 Tax=Solanum bulbocastanum TaxID=147425 RepID=A0AAN8T5D5_SOLBU
MATAPSGRQLQPSNQSQSVRNCNSYKPQPDASSDSSANSSKLQRIKAIHLKIYHQSKNQTFL